MKRELVLLCMFFEIVGIQKLDASSTNTKDLQTLMRITGIKLSQKPANPNTRDQPEVVSQSRDSIAVSSLNKAAQMVNVVAALQSPVIKKRGIKGS